MRKLKNLGALLFLAAVVGLVGKGWHWAKDSFSIRRIKAELPFETTLGALDFESKEALSQEYRYLGRGHQSYAFLSQDGKYVLKLPRLDLYRPPFWMRACTFSVFDPCRNAFQSDKSHRLRFLLNSFRIAFKELKEETALLYLHLGKTEHLQRSLRIRDRFSRSYLLDLDQTCFLLQKTQQLMMPEVVKALNCGNQEEAKAILDAFLKLVALRASKGIFNKDPSFFRNFGWDGSQGIQIDVGSFYYSDQGDFSFSFLQTTGHVKTWLSQLNKETEEWFGKRMEEIVSQKQAVKSTETCF